MNLIKVKSVDRFVSSLWIALLVFIIPNQAYSNEDSAIPTVDSKRTASVRQENLQSGFETGKRSEFDDYHRGEKVLSDDVGYVIIGVLAIGLAVAVVLIVKNISHSTKMPDP